MLGGILMNAVLNLQKISAKVEEKGIIYTRKCKYEG
ncbi:class III lanthipeptide [Bacillus paranthracis]